MADFKANNPLYLTYKARVTGTQSEGMNAAFDHAKVFLVT